MSSTIVTSKPKRTLNGFTVMVIRDILGFKIILQAIAQVLDGRLSKDLGDTLNKVPKSIRRQLLLILASRGFLHNNQLFVKNAKKLTTLALSSLEITNNESKTLPVTEIFFDEINRDTFFDKYIREAQPFVIKNFPFTAHKKWSLDWLIEYCGDAKVILTDLDKDSDQINYVGTLSELKNKERSIYVHNSENILLEHPELIKDLNFGVIESLTKWKFVCAQIFLGSKIKTGTHYHCARDTNFFYMIRGKKTWTFVDPRNTLLIYPYLTPSNGYQDCLVPGFNDDEDWENFPLYRYCPRLRVTLEPGDVLFNPSWWWHSVQNVTEETIGVSSRWSHTFKTNNLFSALMEATPQLRVHRRTFIEAILSKHWDTRGKLSSSKYYQDNFKPSIFESNSHSEEVAEAKKSGIAQRSWF